MSRLITIPLFFILWNTPSMWAQSLITFAGGNVAGSGIDISWTAGELVIATASDQENAVTQGYQQPAAIFEMEDTTATGEFTVDVITANDDGINDWFIIKNAESMPDNYLIIINRWREVVYWANGYTNDWKGDTKDGDALPQATYYYTYYPDRRKKACSRGRIHILKE